MAQTEENNIFVAYQRSWEALFLRIGRKETAAFEDNNVGYTDDLINGNARRGLMVWIYRLLRNFKFLKPIEDLDPDAKRQMWGFVKEICEGKTNDIERMKQIAMVFYTIEYFLNEKNA